MSLHLVYLHVLCALHIVGCLLKSTGMDEGKEQKVIDILRVLRGPGRGSRRLRVDE